jgi:hypothetical protein
MEEMTSFMNGLEFPAILRQRRLAWMSNWSCKECGNFEYLSCWEI